MELLDVINEKGKVIKQKDRKAIYKDGDLHRTVHVWVINSKKELLVQKRSPKKDTYANLWAISTAGHVKAGETNLESAIRELKEELGINATINDLEYLFSIRRKESMKDDVNINTIDDVYIIEADLDVDKTKVQISELTDIKFVYYEYLEQIYKNEDETYVPASEEHEKLFKYLHDRYDDHDKMNVLYKSEFEYTLSEQMKLTKIYNIYNIVYNSLLIVILVCNLCAIASFVLLHDHSQIPVIVFEILVIIIVFYFIPKFKGIKLFESYNIFKNKTVNYVFCDDYFTVKNKQVNIKVFYKDLYKVVETNDNFYLLISTNTSFIIVKNNIDSSFSSFIKCKLGKKYRKINR